MPEETRKTPVVVSVINLKGGVGKTTVVALMARYAARKGLNVLAVDLDPQANLSQALMTEREYMKFMQKGESSIVELFNGYLPPSTDRAAPGPLDQIIRKVGGRDNFHLIPSRFDFSDNLISSIRVDERVLAKYIASKEMGRDLILIDCAPTESVLTRTAYHASRHVLVPVKPEFFSTIGFPLLRESLNQFKSDHPSHAIDVCGVLINYSETRHSRLGPHHRDAQHDIHEKAKEYEWPVMRNHMYHSRGYPKLMKEEYPSSTGNAGPEFRKIAKAFMKMMNLLHKKE